jgi:hypothetical protein
MVSETMTLIKAIPSQWSISAFACLWYEVKAYRRDTCNTVNLFGLLSVADWVEKVRKSVPFPNTTLNS